MRNKPLENKIGVEEPTKEDIKAAKIFERKKKKLKLLSLSQIK